LGTDSKIGGLLMKLYHAAPKETMMEIIANGCELKPSGWEGVVYLAGPLPAHAAVFIALRNHKEIWIAEIDSEDLDPEKLSESFDHSARFFPEDLEAFCYEGTIKIDIDKMYTVEV
jgi:hypothetical protein